MSGVLLFAFGLGSECWCHRFGSSRRSAWSGRTCRVMLQLHDDFYSAAPRWRRGFYCLFSACETTNWPPDRCSCSRGNKLIRKSHCCHEPIASLGSNNLTLELDSPLSLSLSVFPQVTAPQASVCHTCCQVTPPTCHLRRLTLTPCWTASWGSSLTCRCWSR